MQRHERSFGGFWLSPTPPTRLDEGSSRAKHALLAENARSTELPTDFGLPYSSTPYTPTVCRNSTKTIHSLGESDRVSNGHACLHSRIPPVENGPLRLDFFYLILLVLLLIVSRVDFIVFVLLLEAVGVRGYCCMAIENRLAALCFGCSSRATRASRATNLRPSGLVALGLAESRQSYVRGVALSREPPNLQQA